MSKSKSYLTASIILLLIAILFIVFALNNPQMSFPWSNSITYIIYAAYTIITLCMFGLAIKHRKKE